jgi:activating signal cointegrator complex subunit 2
LKMLSMRLVNFGWRLLDAGYLSEEVVEDCSATPSSTKILPSKVEDPMVRGEVILQTFREISSISVQVREHQNHETLLHKIQRSYDIVSRIQSLQSSGKCLDSSRNCSIIDSDLIFTSLITVQVG